jgi:hypothetical protein
MLDEVRFMDYHAFTNISIGVLWCLSGTLIIWVINPYSFESASRTHLIAISFSGLTTLITAVDAVWYVFILKKDHVEKEFLTSVVFFFVNVVLSLLFFKITNTFKKLTTATRQTEFEAANLKESTDA